jgi:hypothetical protein
MTLRALLLVLMMTLSSSVASAQRLTYRGCERLHEDFAAGLSGITYAGDGMYWGVLEWEAKLLRLRILTRDDGSIESVKIEDTIQMRRGSDFEGVAFSPTRPDTLIVSNETPEVVEVSLKDGRGVRSVPLPNLFRQIVKNQGLESLAYSADGKTLWTANERALKIDGNPQTPATPFLSSTRVRLLRFALHDGRFEPAEQCEYQTGGVHGAAGQIGLCDLAALPDGRLLSLERSAAQGLSGKKSIRSRIYLVDTTDATDISKPPFAAGLVKQTPTTVRKTLLFDDFVCDGDGENLEGLCLGPSLGPDKWAVLGVVDNTDGGVGVSKPAVVSFEFDLKAPPTSQPATTRPATPLVPSPGTPGEG